MVLVSVTNESPFVGSVTISIAGVVVVVDLVVVLVVVDVLVVVLVERVAALYI